MTKGAPETLDIADMCAGALERKPGAVAAAISLVENRRPELEGRAIELLRALSSQGRRDRCHRVGLTGPPGVGKSTLVAALSESLRGRGKSVGVLAVDPSSTRSGGSLLGDRARMRVDPDDRELFVRSMASGGDLGGLSRAAGAAVDVLSAVFDVVLVETTGVGQSETDVEHVADTVVLVIQPGSGDVLQFLKAGILEIPDIFVVNKLDLGVIAERSRADLRAAINATHGAGSGDEPPVIATSATEGGGLSELADVLSRRYDGLTQSGELDTLRVASAARWALRLFTQRYGDFGVAKRGGPRKLESRLATWISSGMTAVEAVSREG